MDEIEIKLQEVKVQLKRLGLYSLNNALLLQQVFQCYDEVIKQLYFDDKTTYSKSKINIGIISPKILLIFMPSTSIEAKIENYNTSKLLIKISVNADLYNYERFLKTQRKMNFMKQDLA